MKLYELVRSMSANEKRFLTLRYNSVNSKGTAAKIIFDFMNQTDNADETLLKEKMISSKYKQAKKNLYENILSVIISHSSNISPKNKVFYELAKTEVLIERGLYNDAYKKLKKLLKAAKNVPKNIVLQLNVELFNVMQKMVINNPALHTEITLTCQKISELQIYFHDYFLYQKVHSLIFEYQWLREKDENRVKVFDEILEKYPILHRDITSIHPELLSLHYEILGIYHTLKGDSEACFLALDEVVYLFKKEKALVVDEHFVQVLSYYLRSVFFLNKLEKFEKIYCYSKEVVIGKLLKFELKLLLRYLEAIVIGTFDKWKKDEISYIEKYIANPTEKDAKTMQTIVYLKYRLAEFYFQLELYEKVPEALYDLVNKREYPMLQDYLTGGFYILILSYLELNKKKMAEKYINALIYYLRSSKETHNFQQEVGNLLIRFVRNWNKVEKVKKLHQELYTYTQSEYAAWYLGSKVLERYVTKKLSKAERINRVIKPKL